MNYHKIKYKYWNIGVSEMNRKTKKAVIGKKMGKSKLRQLLKSVEIVKNGKCAGIKPYTFCPKCGCTHTRSTNNMASYPELWVKIYCARCGFLVEKADNSPYVHALECADYNYEIN